MTKKHFIALADALRQYRKNGTLPDVIVNVLGSFCQEVNPRFKMERWIEYLDGKCGPNGGKIK